MPKKQTAKAPVSISDLSTALSEKNFLVRDDVFERYSKQKPTADAVPILRQALHDEYHAVVKVAAMTLGKLGPLAAEAMSDLRAAATKLAPPSYMPQAYPQCIEAMVKIDATNRMLVPLIKQFVGLDNWVPLSASLRVLKMIGSPEAVDLLRRMAKFWEPEFNKMQKRVVEELLEK